MKRLLLLLAGSFLAVSVHAQTASTDSLASTVFQFDSRVFDVALIPVDETTFNPREYGGLGDLGVVYYGNGHALLGRYIGKNLAEYMFGEAKDRQYRDTAKLIEDPLLRVSPENTVVQLASNESRTAVWDMRQQLASCGSPTIYLIEGWDGSVKLVTGIGHPDIPSLLRQVKVCVPEAWRRSLWSISNRE